MPLHGVFRTVIDMIEVKGICPLHLDEVPDAVAATKSPRSGQAGRARQGARPSPRYLGSEWSDRSVAAATPAVMATAATESGSEQ